MKKKIRFRYTYSLELEADQDSYPGVDPLQYEKEYARDNLIFALEDGRGHVSVEIVSDETENEK